jgi:hypothetical protein
LGLANDPVQDASSLYLMNGREFIDISMDEATNEHRQVEIVEA